MKEVQDGSNPEFEAAVMSCDEASSDLKQNVQQDPVLVADEEGDEPIELPTETDDTLLLTTLAAQFPGTSGLRYRNPQTNAMRGIRLTDGKLHPPLNGWGNCVYYCVFPKENKRKSNDDMSNSTAKTKRVDTRMTCSDLIVLGLPYKTAEKQLKEYFEAFGQVVRVKIRRDPRTGHSKGFGFVRFKNYEVQEKVLSENHSLDGCVCYVKLFNAKEGDLSDKEARKVFVGGCTEDIKGDDLRDYFTAFGGVTNVFIPKTFRAFAFVTFIDPEVAQSLCGEAHVIKGVTVQVSSAARKHEQGRRFGFGGGAAGGGGQVPVRRNLQPVRLSGPSQGAGGNGQNPLGVGPVPMNAAVIAAALSQVGWNFAAGLQGNMGPGGSAMCQNPVFGQGGMPVEADARNDIHAVEMGGMDALSWRGGHEAGPDSQGLGSLQ